MNDDLLQFCVPVKFEVANNQELNLAACFEPELLNLVWNRIIQDEQLFAVYSNIIARGSDTNKQLIALGYYLALNSDHKVVLDLREEERE